MTLPEILETIMIICFGLSWPMNIIKSIRSKTAKGKSLLFLILIWIGYVAGITWKIIVFQQSGFSLAFIFYIINLLMVSTDMALYFVNRGRDKEREKAARAK